MIKVQDILKTAVITRNGHISYKEFLQRIYTYAGLYKDKSCKIIGVYGENSLEWLTAFYSGWMNDCIVVPIEYMAPIEDVAYIINDCNPDILFVSPKLEQNIKEITPMLQANPEIYYMEDFPLSEDENIQWKMPADPDKTALIIYTSGTTGNPKGVMLSYKNLITIIDGVSKEVEIFTADRQVLILLPLHHILPLMGSLVAPFYVGSSVVICPSMQTSDLLETLQKNQVAIMIGVPRLYELIRSGLKSKIDASFLTRTVYQIARIIGNRNLSRKIFKKVHDGFGGKMMFMVCGGASLPKPVGTFYKTVGFEVLEGYGMTEAAPLITFSHPGKVRVSSPGFPMPGLAVEIRNGEIVAKGDNIMSGYYNQPEETRAALRDGWLYTGDLGYFDKDGYLFITGRKKELIVLPNGKILIRWSWNQNWKRNLIPYGKPECFFIINICMPLFFLTGRN